MATLREKICASGVSTFREFVCLGIGEGGGTDRLIPYDDLVLNLEIDTLSIDLQTDTLDIEIQSKEIDAQIESREMMIDIQTTNKEIDNGCN